MSDISTVFSRQNGADLEVVDKASGTVVLAFRNAAGSMPVFGPNQDTLTAHSGGGQTNALALTGIMNRITTVAAGNDSVVLPVSLAGMEITVINAAASNSMNVFPNAAEGR